MKIALVPESVNKSTPAAFTFGHLAGDHFKLLPTEIGWKPAKPEAGRTIWKHFCTVNRAERGFLIFGEALVKAQV